MSVVGGKKVFTKADKRNKKKEEEEAKDNNPLFSFDRLLHPSKRAAPIAPHRQA